MRITSLPVAVLMQRRPPSHPWAQDSWAAVGVSADAAHAPSTELLPDSMRIEEAPVEGASGEDASADPATQTYLVRGLRLELHPDENDGYFENWAAPSPRVFVMWQMRGEQAAPVSVSVSYGEGTRMLDAGDGADGVPMPPEIHAWLTDYLRKHYKPRPRRGREHG
jgi:hypothetical protein